MHLIVPGFPRNVTVIVINSFSVNLTWIHPIFPKGVLLTYKLYWKKVAIGEKNVEQTMNVPLQYSKVITGLCEYFTYSLKS